MCSSDLGAKLLVTSRFARLVPDAVDIVVEDMTTVQAMQLLQAGEQLEDKELRSMHRACVLCHNHALALSMVASMRQMTGWSWTKISEYLENHKCKVKWTNSSYNTSYKGLMECIELSMQCLSPDQRARYEALAVLPEDVWMPQELLQVYWGLDEWDTLKAIKELRNRSLVQMKRSTAKIGRAHV